MEDQSSAPDGSAVRRPARDRLRGDPKVRRGLARRLGFFVLSALALFPRPAVGQSRDAEHYQLLLKTKAHVKGIATIGGNIGVTAPGGLLAIGHNSTVADGRELVADKVYVRNYTRAFDVFANIPHVGRGGVVAGAIIAPILPPIYDPEPLVMPDPFDPANFPAAFPITCSGTNRAGRPGEIFTLTPGSYGKVTVGPNGKLVLQAGTYQFCSLEVVKYGGIFADAPATINVRDIFLIGSSSAFVPVGNPSDIQINVQGPLARVGSYSTFSGRIFAPNAKLRIGGLALVTGHMVAKQLTTDAAPQMFTCGNGRLDAGEQCDTSAPNGDAACPGTCVPPGQPNECTCSTPPTTT